MERERVRRAPSRVLLELVSSGGTERHATPLLCPVIQTGALLTVAFSPERPVAIRRRRDSLRRRARFRRPGRRRSNLPSPRPLAFPCFTIRRTHLPVLLNRQGFVAARSFVHSHFLSRLLPDPTTTLASPTAISDLVPLLKFDRPTHLLANKLRSFSLPSPSHRLLKESGRLSSRPTFLSGVFSGDKKIGEGFGSSIKMSEHRASEDALRRLYFAGREEGEGLPSDGWAR